MQTLHSALPELMAEARARANEFETERQLAPDFVDRLKACGAFRVLVPTAAGGLGGSLVEFLEFMMPLAEADASTGWVTAHANICAGLIYASAEPRFRDEFFADPQACAAWSNLPRIQAREQDDGLRITGSWGFESGCTAATFVGGMALLESLAEGGAPRMVAALAPVAEARIEKTWDPVGLAGTGSHDVHFDDVYVPWSHLSVAVGNRGVRIPGGDLRAWHLVHYDRCGGHASRTGPPGAGRGARRVDGKDRPLHAAATAGASVHAAQP